MPKNYDPNKIYEPEPYTLQETLNAGMGPGCVRKYFDSTTPIESTQRYFAIQIINDAIFTDLTDEEEFDDTLSGLLSTYTFPAGFVLYGSFTDIKLDSGFVVGYIKKGGKVEVL